MSSKQFLEVGQVIGTRGILGEIKVKSFCDTPEVFCQIPRLYFYFGKEIINVLNKRVFKKIVLMKINGVQKIEDCTNLIGRYIYADRQDVNLPKSRYFIDDIIGIDVIDTDTQINYGKVFDVIKTGANDVYCIRGRDSKEYLLPAVNEIITDINIDKNILFVRPIKGIFNE